MKNKIIGIFVCMLLISNILISTGNILVESRILSTDSIIKTFDLPRNDDSFDSKVKLLMRLAHIPSMTIGVLKNNSIVWSKAYGYADIYNQKVASTDMIYQVASISKTFIATALLQLYEQGVFDLDDDVGLYLPFDLKNPKYPDVNITFRMLLSHHSSFVCRDIESMFQPLEPVEEITVRNIIQIYLITWLWVKDHRSGFYPEEKYPWIQEVMVSGGKLYYEEHWGDYPPGEDYYYSNTAYILLGYLLECLTDQKCEDYCKDHLFEPLGMYNTSFYLDDLNPDFLATPYMWIHRIFIPVPHYDYRCHNPACGLRTNLEDLSHWLIVHMNGGLYNGVRILNESTIEEMHTVQYPHIEPANYGLGWGIQNDSTGLIQGHSGSTMGCESGMFSFHPTNSSEQYGIIYFINEDSGAFIRFLPQYKDLLLREILFLIFLNKIVEL